MHKEKNGQSQVQNWSTASASLSDLFFHNTMPEYRIGWFCNLAKELKCTFLSNGVAGFIELIKILEDIENYDFVELPPLDSLREVIYGAYIVFKAKTKKG